MGDNFQREIKLIPVSLYVVSVTRNQLSHIVGIHSMGFIICGTYNIYLYTVLISAVDGQILLLPVCVHHAENARESLPTL